DLRQLRAHVVVRLLVEKNRAEVDVDHAALRDDPLDLIVGEIARMSAIERHDECDAITGARDTSSTSSIVPSETCETSTIIPSRFISFTTSRPNPDSPSCT